MSLASFIEELRVYGIDDFYRAAKKNGITDVTVRHHETDALDSGTIHYFTLSGKGLRPAVTDVFVSSQHSIPGVLSDSITVPTIGGKTIEHDRITEKLLYIKKELGDIHIVYDNVPKKYLAWLEGCQS